MPLRISSPVFSPSEPIPKQYTCEGDDRSPPLEWSNAPAGAKSLALIVDDPDAPDPRAPKRTFVHWVIVDLPPDSSGIPEGATRGDLPVGARQGKNDWDREGWGGPCPPTGRHRYFFKLYALDKRLDGLTAPTKAELERAMEGHVLEQAEVVGTYELEG